MSTDPSDNWANSIWWRLWYSLKRQIKVVNCPRAGNVLSNVPPETCLLHTTALKNGMSFCTGGHHLAWVTFGCDLHIKNIYNAYTSNRNKWLNNHHNLSWNHRLQVELQYSLCLHQWELTAAVWWTSPAGGMSAYDHSSSALWRHPLRAVESLEASLPSPQPDTSNLNPVCPRLPGLKWRGLSGYPPPPTPHLKTFPGPYLRALIQDNFYHLQITGSVTQLPTKASVILEIDRVSRGQQLGQGQTTAGAGCLY